MNRRNLMIINHLELLVGGAQEGGHKRELTNQV